jgi:hypothetical protein
VQYEGDGEGRPVAVKKSNVVLVERSILSEHPFEDGLEEQKQNQDVCEEYDIQSQLNNRQEYTRTKNHDGKERKINKDSSKEKRIKHGQDDENRHHEHNRDRRSSKRPYEESDRSSHNHTKESHTYRDKRPCHEKSHEHWLLTNIRVRVVTKKIAKGRHFLEKGIVLDVLKQGLEATLQMSNGDILERVPERYLETALPKVGGNVIILTGRHKCEKGKLLERNSEKGKGVVQLFEDMNVVTLSLDDIAEYCAPLDETIGDY